MSNEERLALAHELAHEAGELLREGYGQSTDVKTKKSPTDLLTEYDLAAEALLLDRLRREYPQDGILSEEAGQEGSTAARWILDPLDGTTNFAHGLPIFCVSIAYVVGIETQVGVVYAPILDEMFSARRGAGAQLNGRPLQVSSNQELEDSLLATGFPYDIRTSQVTNLDKFGALSVRTRAVRRLGSAALDICYTAAGRFAGYWELATNPWDYAAGALMILEAGGRISQLDGSPLTYRGRSTVLATNGRIHMALKEALEVA